MSNRFPVVENPATARVSNEEAIQALEPLVAATKVTKVIEGYTTGCGLPQCQTWTSLLRPTGLPLGFRNLASGFTAIGIVVVTGVMAAAGVVAANSRGGECGDDVTL